MRGWKREPASVGRSVGAVLLFVLTAALVFTPALWTSAGAQDKDGICVIGNIGLSGTSPGTCYTPVEAKGLMTAAVSSRGVRLTNPSSTTQVETVTTCEGYFEKSAAGWYAMTGREMAAEGSFRRTCGFTRAVANAGLPQNYYISETRGLGSTDLLMESMLPVMGEGIAVNQGATLEQADKEGRCTIQAASRNLLLVSTDEMEATYEVMAMADFNKDGYEDMLVFLAARAKGGSAQFTDVFALTRRAAGGPFEVIDMDLGF